MDITTWKIRRSTWIHCSILLPCVVPSAASFFLSLNIHLRLTLLEYHVVDLLFVFLSLLLHQRTKFLEVLLQGRKFMTTNTQSLACSCNPALLNG